MDLETILLIKAFKSLDTAMGGNMCAYWEQWDKSELDAMQGIEAYEDEDHYFEELVRMNEDLGDISDDPCAECSGCNSCFGVAL